MSIAETINTPQVTNNNVGEVDQEGKTELHRAVEKGNRELVEQLLSEGAEVNVVDKYGRTPVEYAEIQGFSVLAGLLRAVGGVGMGHISKESVENHVTSPTDPHNQLLINTYVDMASEKSGGKALWASDEWFAAAENLLKPGRGTFQLGVFTDRGQLMDGWETARHGAIKRGGVDRCIIKLAAPGIVRGFDIDTNHFTGNYVPAASVDGIYATNDISLEDLKKADWEQLLPISKLGSSSQHIYKAKNIKKCTHVRLNVHPDGGIARFRVYGEFTPDWTKKIESKEVIELSSILLGGKVVSVSDNFYSHQDHALLPGRGVNMGDGWETRRSRRNNNREWIIIKLARAGEISMIEVDTNHFKGNFPDSALMDGCFGEGTEWKELLPRQKLQAHAQHYFQNEVKHIGPVTHVRVTIFPDGGISRIRLHGIPATIKELVALNYKIENAIKAQPLAAELFVAFGDVFSVAEHSTQTIGQRFQWTTQITGQSDTTPSMSYIRFPQAVLPLNVDFLDKYTSSQTYIPFGNTKTYLVIGALPSKIGGQPNMLNFATFVANKDQVITIKAGIYHRIFGVEENAEFMVLSNELSTPEKPVNVIIKTSVISLP